MTSLTVREAFNGSMNSKNSPAVRSIRILPQQPSNSLGGKCPVVANHGVSAVKPDSFFEAFGSIGILLLLGAGVSVCWTAWLTILSIAPNDTANYLMDTADLDDGYFWLIADPEPELMSVNTFVLVGLAVSYIHVMLKMTVLRNSSFRIAPVGPRREEVSVSPIWAARLPHIGDYLQQAASFWLELTGYYGQYRKFWNVLFKVGDLIVESIQLNHLLEAGFSVSLSLCYTGVEIIPDWFKVFHKLEFFDIEGKFGDTNVVKMPSDAFSRLNSLTFLHFGYLPLLLELPSFKGLSNLKSMSLAILLSISSLPELKPLVKLQRLELVAMYSLQRLPDLTSNQHLKHLFLVNAPLCCNGFLSKCNQSHPACNGPTCLPSSDHISDANLAIFTTQPVACDPNALYFPPPQPIAKYQVDMCGGVMYRRCYDPVYQSADVEVVGICMNNFFQVISCSSSDIYAINGRQQEIIHGFGLPCDPVEEAWLGCVKP
ncbi:hypothetical protein PF010_g25267 [Phytophthora fragariae]|uniref:WLGC domain-containing protein n=1 Tax=Phytophthora fragariae TaxID=53985 RepID=A0A6G0K087_9STRA|nr:hypothetical protein PF010_g25267 [Phytophthora fragariae]